MRSTAPPPTRGRSSPKTTRSGTQARGKAASSGRGTGSRTGTARRTGPTRTPPPTNPAVFRRRRLVVLLGLIAVVVVVAFGIRSAIGAIAQADEALPRDVTTSVPHPDPNVEPTGPPSEEELANPVDCRPYAVDLSIEMATTLNEGATTSMPVTVTNDGQVPCLLDVGGAQVVLTIYSGDDLVWTSQHCTTRGDRRILLDAEDQDTISFRWTGTRSAAGCPDDQPVAEAGTYRAVVTLLTAGDQPEELATLEKPFTVK